MVRKYMMVFMMVNRRNVSQHTVHCTLLRMRLHRYRPVRVSMLTPVHRSEDIALGNVLLGNPGSRQSCERQILPMPPT